MSFKDDIRKVVAQARSKSLDEENPFVRVLGDFAEALTSDSVIAEVVAPSRGGRRRDLCLCPRYRPAFATILLSLLIEDEGVTIMTDTRRRLSTRELFEQYLKDFVQDEGFLASLAELERQYAAPVEAYLRVHDPYRITRDDVLLIIPPDEQRRLFGVNDNESVELQLEVGGAAGAGAYRLDVAYQYLNSAGVLLQIDSTERDPDGRIRVVGRRLKSNSAVGSAYEHMSDDSLRDTALKLASGLRGLASIYRRDRKVLDDAPTEEARRKALHYAATLEALQEYIRDQYVAKGVQVRECTRELKRRLRDRAPEEPAVDFFRPDDPSVDIDSIADFLETAGRILAPPSVG